VVGRLVVASAVPGRVGDAAVAGRDACVTAVPGRDIRTCDPPDWAVIGRAGSDAVTGRPSGPGPGWGEIKETFGGPPGALGMPSGAGEEGEAGDFEGGLCKMSFPPILPEPCRFPPIEGLPGVLAREFSPIRSTSGEVSSGLRSSLIITRCSRTSVPWFEATSKRHAAENSVTRRSTHVELARAWRVFCQILSTPMRAGTIFRSLAMVWTYCLKLQNNARIWIAGSIPERSTTPSSSVAVSMFVSICSPAFGPYGVRERDSWSHAMFVPPSVGIVSFINSATSLRVFGIGSASLFPFSFRPVGSGSGSVGFASACRSS